MCSEASTSPPCAHGAQTGVRTGRAVGTGGSPSPPPAAGPGTRRHRRTGPLAGSSRRQPCCRTTTPCRLPPCRIEGWQHRRLLEEGKMKGCALGRARRREQCRALPSWPSGLSRGLLGGARQGPCDPSPRHEGGEEMAGAAALVWLAVPLAAPSWAGSHTAGRGRPPLQPVRRTAVSPLSHCPAAAKGASSGTAPPCAGGAPPHAPVSAPTRGTATLSRAGPAVPETGAPAPSS